MKRRIVIVSLIMIMLIVALTSALYYKKPISEATFSDLCELEDIGEVLAGRIVLYVTANPSCNIDDLLDVKGIGQKRLKTIKRKYR